MNRAVPPDADVITGQVVPADDVSGAAPVRFTPRLTQPGAFRLMWRHHGRFVRPFLWIPAIWADALAVWYVVPLGARLLLAILPAALTALAVLRGTRRGSRERLHAAVSVPSALGWVLLAGWLHGRRRDDGHDDTDREGDRACDVRLPARPLRFHRVRP